ncbi:MAG: hypothetical protein K2L64_02885, partial [Ureaplasma sp.]|nr:hypothetical protein [Ureaplasma sp.]
SIVIEVSKLNSLKSNIQNYIDKQENQFTREEFVAQINSLSFKNEVASQLGILSTEINKISYENNILTITPNDMQKFDASVANNNFIVNNNIQVENFNFYQSQTLTQTENLFLKLNEYIANAKYTSEEFADKVNSKDATVAKIINDNLLISTPNETDPDKETFTPINPDQIVNYTFENNKLLINLDTNSLKYNLASTNNVSIDNGTLIVKNFTFYTSVVIEDAKLNSFKSSVQSLIDTNKYTQSDFESQLSSLAFRNSIATSLGIVASNINAINFSNNTLEITPLQNQKFVSSIPTNNNSNLVNDNVQVSSFTFFSSFTITNTNNLFNSLQNYISSNSDTIDEFKTKVNSNDTTITSLIQDNLLVIEDQSTKPIDTNYITNFEFTNNQLEINLNTNYLKYSLSTSENNSDNVSINDGKLIVNNFTFFTAISIENDKLNTLKDNVQSLIQNQQYTLSDFQNQLSTLVFKNAIANYLGIQSTSINSISYENDILKIIPQENQKFVSNALNNSLIVDNTIQITITKFYDSYTLTNLNKIYESLYKYIGENK